jgi:hypothetical protein
VRQSTKEVLEPPRTHPPVEKHFYAHFRPLIGAYLGAKNLILGRSKPNLGPSGRSPYIRTGLGRFSGLWRGFQSGDTLDQARDDVIFAVTLFA